MIVPMTAFPVGMKKTEIFFIWVDSSIVAGLISVLFALQLFFRRTPNQFRRILGEFFQNVLIADFANRFHSDVWFPFVQRDIDAHCLIDEFSGRGLTNDPERIRFHDDRKIFIVLAQRQGFDRLGAFNCGFSGLGDFQQFFWRTGWRRHLVVARGFRLLVCPLWRARETTRARDCGDRDDCNGDRFFERILPFRFHHLFWGLDAVDSVCHVGSPVGWLVGGGGWKRLFHFFARGVFLVTCRQRRRSYAGRGGAGLWRARYRNLGISDFRILAFGFSARGRAARPDSREILGLENPAAAQPPPRFRGEIPRLRESETPAPAAASGRNIARTRRRRSRPRDSAARFPEPENPRIRHPAAPGGRADAMVLFCCVCQEGSAPRSVSSPGLLGKPCLKTRKETRSNGAHPCFVPFKLECSKDSGERRLAVCCFSAASVRACALRAATSENIPDSGFRRKRIPKWNHFCTCRRPRPSYARSSRRLCSGPALERLNLTQSAQSHAPPSAQAFESHAERAEPMLRPALERLNHTQRAQSLAPLYAQAVVEPASRAGTKRQSRLKTLRGLCELRVRVFTGARAERGSAFSAHSA